MRIDNIITMSASGCCGKNRTGVNGGSSQDGEIINIVKKIPESKIIIKLNPVC
jgi:hypothetical protein